MKTQLFTKYEELKKISERWNQLVLNSDDPQIFYLWDWVDTYLDRSLSKNDEIFIVTVWDDSELIGIAPMKIIRKNLGVCKQRILTNLLSEYVDYSAFVIDKNVKAIEVLKKICDQILEYKKKWDIIQLDNFNSNCKTAWLLKDIMTYKGFVDVSRYVNVTAPYLDYIDYDRVFDKKHLSDMSRRKKKLEKEAQIEIVVGSEINNEIWEKLVTFHKENYKGVGFSHRICQLFYGKLISRQEMADKIEFSYFVVNKEIAAVHFGFIYADRVYYYVPSYNKNYSKFGVGNLLLKEIIDHYREKGYKTFDFLRGSENYKNVWTDKCQFNFSFNAVAPQAALIHRLMFNFRIAFKLIPILRNLRNKLR